MLVKTKFANIINIAAKEEIIPEFFNQIVIQKIYLSCFRLFK